MQPTLLTAIQSRLDLPDPGRCTECQLLKVQAGQPRRSSRVRARLRRR